VLSFFFKKIIKEETKADKENIKQKARNKQKRIKSLKQKGRTKILITKTKKQKADKNL